MKETLCKSCEFSNICRTGKDSLNESKVKILGCSRYEKREIKTNGDRIRSMTDEELAEFANVDGLTPWCENHNPCPQIKNDPCDCSPCMLDWLKQEAKE